MTKFSTGKILIAVLAIFITYSFSMILMPDPPTVTDITVCNGEPTIIVPSAAGGGGEEELAYQDFEFSGGGGQELLMSVPLFFFPSVEFNDGTNDHFAATDGSDISNVSGPYSFEDGVNVFWAAEDVDDNGGDGNSEQNLTFDPLSISGFSNIKFSFDLAAGNENPQNTSPGYDFGGTGQDYVIVEYAIDNGPFETGMCFRPNRGDDDFNDPLHHDVNCDGNGDDGVQIVNEAQNFEFELPAATVGATNVTFRILVQMTSGSEEVAFDNISILGTPSAPVSYNYYDVDYNADTSVAPIAMGPTYDPMTTVATSPDTIWVTSSDINGESAAVPVIVTVLADADAGANQFACNASEFQLNALVDGGTWSGGLGTFADASSASTTYFPSGDEFDKAIVLTYSLAGSTCDVSDEIILYNASEMNAEFSYPLDSVCPGDGIIAPIFTDGQGGIFTVVSGNEDDLDLDPVTGEINLANSELGDYTIRNTVSSCGNLMISGVVDGDLPNGLPKAIELYAINDIPDLSIYGLGSANNGGGTDGIEFTFPADMAMKGDYIYVATESSSFASFFGFEPTYLATSAASINGDDAVELFCEGEVIDVYGDINTNGDGEPWDYTNGWAHRISGDTLNFGSFDDTKWTYSGLDGLEDETDNATAAVPFPVSTYTTDFMGICPNSFTEVDFVITDFGGPMTMCPPDLTISLDGGECGVVANLLDASVLDNCSENLTLEQVSGPVSGDFLDQDNSPYTVVFEGTADNGDIVSCSYNIYVEAFEATGNTLVCNGAINLTLDENCEGLITADMLLEGNNYVCYDDFGIAAYYNDQPIGASVPSAYGIGNYLILDNSVLNEPIEVRIIEPNGVNYCWGDVIVEDKISPVIDCPDVVTVSCTNTAIVEPAVIDNCDNYTLIMEENVIDGTCDDDFYQQIIRVWVAIDAAGNQSDECVQILEVEKDLFSELQFPENFDGLDGNPVLECKGENVEFALDEYGNPNPVGTNSLIGTGVPVLGEGCSNLIVFYDDVIVPVCGNHSYKVLRDWTVIEWCTGEQAQHTQVIKVVDITGPEVTALEDVTVSVDKHCHGEYQIPFIFTSDDCGEVNITYDVEFGEVDNNYFRVDEPVLGQAYKVNVVATDDCDNPTVSSFNVTFVDLVPPVVNAETSLTVTLSADGTAKLFANSFDDGSYDACGDVEFSVLRNFSTCDPIDYDEPAGDDNFQFNDIVHFCCADEGEPQMVTFRVCDDADGNGEYGSKDDNCNTAMVEVTVQNKLAPILICPPPMTVNCLDAAGLDLTNNDLMNELFGEPQIMNSCSGTMISQSIDQENCGEGIIIRQFIALGGGQSEACSQIITIVPNVENTLTCDRINFASLNNNVYDWCSVNDNINDNDDNLPAIEVDCNEGLAIPELDIDITNLCTEVGVNITVDTFNFAGGACKKFLVHYEVIDQCVFDENYIDPLTGEVDPYNSGNGYFEMFIEIDAFDNEGPTADLSDVTIVAEDCETGKASFGLTASDNCTEEKYISYGYKIDLFSDDSFDITKNGDYIYSKLIVSGVNGVPSLPVGEHTLYVILADGCGNTSTASQKIIVTANEKQPTTYCRTGYTASISAMGMVMVSAEDFDAGSFDNCTPSEDLLFSFSEDVNDTERTYTCDELGFQFVTIYVTDADGNQDFCNATFLVQDNQNFCNGSMVSGLVQSTNGYVNKDAMVMIDETGSNFQVMTDENGSFEIADVNYSDEATVTVEDYNSVLHGITVADIVNIRKHILGIATLPTNAQIISADVDNNTKINGIDIIQIRKLLLGHVSTFPNHMSWVAIPSDFDVESLNDPFDYPMTINLNAATNLDFTTIKVGDVNGSHAEGLVSHEDASTRSSYDIEYVEKVIDGETIYELYADVSDLVGLEWMIQKVDFSIESPIFEISSENTNVLNNVQKLVWAELHEESGVQHFATLRGNVNISDLKNSANKLQALTGKGAETNVENISLRERDSKLVKPTASVYPNPFSDETTIELHNFEGDNITVEIFTIEGKLVYKNEFVNNNQITLGESQIPNQGVYTIHLSDGNTKLVKKLMKIK